jgi:hypothetical protein
MLSHWGWKMVSLTCGVAEKELSWAEARIENLAKRSLLKLHQNSRFENDSSKVNIKKETSERNVINLYTADSPTIRQELLFLETGCG